MGELVGWLTLYIGGDTCMASPPSLQVDDMQDVQGVLSRVELTHDAVHNAYNRAVGVTPVAH